MDLSFRNFIEAVGRAAQSPAKPEGPATQPATEKQKEPGNVWDMLKPSPFNPSLNMKTNFKRPQSPLSPGTKPLWPVPPSPMTFDPAKTSKTYHFFDIGKLAKPVKAQGPVPQQNKK